MQDCPKCKVLASTRKQVVFGTGNPIADVVVVGEAPGADEDQQGKPFVGRAGKLLT
ncbi:MAG: uracil-DNA glycosylase, partial [Bacteroidota bacterium]|nr:uracil-DNA glycosylase [Bacteroidota bacterium]